MLLQNLFEKLFYSLFANFCLTEAILFTLEYLRYPTVQRIGTKTRTRFDFPSVTFCDANIALVRSFRDKTTCKVNKFEYDLHRNDSIFTKRDHLKCVTFFSQLRKDGKNYSMDVTSHFLLLLRLANRSQTVCVHPPTTPPQNAELLLLMCNARLKTHVIRERLKPPPFDTDCFDYKIEKYKSQKDCQLQLHEGKKASGLYFKKFTKFEKIFIAYEDNNLPRKPINSKKSTGCRKGCNEETYISRFIGNLPWSYCKSITQQTVAFEIDATEIEISHEVEMTFLYLVVQLGGLLSFWFGLSVTSVIKFLTRKGRLWGWHMYVCIIVFDGLLIQQNISLFKSYLRYQTITKVKLSNSYSGIGLFPTPGMLIIAPQKILILEDTFTNKIVNFTAQLWNRPGFNNLNNISIVLDYSLKSLVVEPHLEGSKTKRVTFNVDIKELEMVFGLDNLFTFVLFDWA